MHAVGLHSALAIKRQRKRRDEQKRARERRYSTQSTESGLTSPHNSMGSLAEHRSRGAGRGGAGRGKAPGDAVGSKVVTSVGMLHIGVVFLVLGAFLLVSGLLPEDVNSWGSSITAGGWFNELVVTGAFAFAIGVFLIILNRIISRREEEDLNEYVQRQLTRSRSGHRLIRDVETGCLTTKQQARSRGESQALALAAPALAPVHGSPGPKTPAALQLDGELPLPLPLSPLEPVLEEEASEKGEEEARAMDFLSKEAISNGSTTAGSLSPGSPSETAGLLGGPGRSHPHHLHHAAAPLRI
ncbi:hypothetical protein R5R35_001443 [Gryllus longicercus]